ncbi:MFS general substrate transporter [Suillus clintonianus]|uniref:MFS general substrate transporter n=1 Tax=Suillus clintonianus TaxID=1904413 RepID=UPI001B86E87F|nr:MFS general substrate transporter [Suillus clintonianus]KAG2124884.1 MFS general substrate transporter [Suillus clintonianus]
MTYVVNTVLADRANSISPEHKQHDEERLEDSVLDLKNVPVLTPEQEKKLWRKIDLRLMPILSLMYLLAFLDRGNIGNAKLEGLETQLDLTGNKFNVVLIMFIIPYCLFEPPTNLVLKAFRPSRWLPGINLAWGIIMTLMAFVKTYPQLVGVRVCLGVAEAGLFPGVVYYLTLWYPRHMLQYRIGLFFGAATVAGAFSGLLAFGISYMGGMEGLEAWSWIFLLEGLATIVVAIVAFFVLVDFPHTAKFLTPEERDFVVWRKKYDNSSVGEEERFAARYIWAAFKDWQVWVHILIYMSIVGPLYGITLFLPTIIKSFGYNTPVSQLLTIPPYVAATLTLLVFAHYSDKLKMRSPFILAGLTMCLIGFSINISTAPSGVKYFGTFFIVMGSYAAFPGVVSWLGNNLSGQYKRGVGMALHIGIGNFSGAISSVVYRSQDSPRFILGHGLELMFVGIGLTLLPTVVFIYKRINAQRDTAERLATERGEKVKYSVQELRELGDRAPDFRYTL